jgi:hypothetical protein
MHTRRGSVQGYNAQAVTTLEQVIVAAELTQDANDLQQLEPMLTAHRGDAWRRRPPPAAGDAAGGFGLLDDRQPDRDP